MAVYIAHSCVGVVHEKRCCSPARRWGGGLCCLLVAALGDAERYAYSLQVRVFGHWSLQK